MAPRASLVTLLLLATLPREAVGWSDLGHQLVARIAWLEMEPAARDAAVELLRQAPADSQLGDLDPGPDLPAARRDRMLFERAAIWPDLARDLERYHRGPWHYINYYWETTDSGPPRERRDREPPRPNAVAQLYELEAQLAGRGRDAARRALDLAWILHLVGDLHQPLHSSSRITRSEPDGDRGGNELPLREVPGEDLHGLWDFAIDLDEPRQDDEPFGRYLERVAGEILADHPRERAVRGRLEPGGYRGWARESFELAMTVGYPAGLRPGEAPSREQIERVAATARARIALAGYRLGELLDRLLGGADAASDRPGAGEARPPD